MRIISRIIIIGCLCLFVLFLVGCSFFQNVEGISDEELFGTEEGISDEELFGLDEPDPADVPNPAQPVSK